MTLTSIFDLLCIILMYWDYFEICHNVHETDGCAIGELRNMIRKWGQTKMWKKRPWSTQRFKIASHLLLNSFTHRVDKLCSLKLSNYDHSGKIYSLKFIYSEKATKFCEISTHTVQKLIVIFNKLLRTFDSCLSLSDI